MSLIWWLLFYFIISETSGRRNLRDIYCTITCGKNAKHIACERADNYCRPLPDCNNLKQVTWSYRLRQLILDLHNRLRSSIALGYEKNSPQPQAANMNVLNYNFELEFIAQCLANTCKNSHDECRDTKQLVSGQNLAEHCQSSESGLYNEATVLNAIQKWYDEVKTVSAAEIDSYKLKQSSEHYTQMMWGDIEAIGCGRSFFKKDDGKFCILLVCNYGGKNTGGNTENYAVYKVGRPCSLCPVDKKCNRATGLCGKALPVRNTPTFNHATNVVMNFKLCCLLFVSLILNSILM